MAIIPILRELWRQRFLVSLAALLAIIVGMIAAYRVGGFPPTFEARTYTVAIAQARILLDTPDSQIVAVSPKGSDTLGSRANLLANLMADGEIKAAIVARAGLRPAQLLSVAPGAIEPQTVSPDALKSPKARILTTTVLTNDVGQELPIIDVEAQAPDPAAAARLANAAVIGLGDYLNSRAATDKVVDAQRLNVSGLGAAQTHIERRGPGYVLAIGISVFAFAALCTLILLLGSLARGWRLASRAEALDLKAVESRGSLPPVASVRPRESATRGSIEPPDQSWKDVPEIPRHSALRPPDAAAR